MLQRMFARIRQNAPPTARVPEGIRVYAVGDIHGRADLLERLQVRIADDAAGAPGSSKRIVYLGDYIDRGEDSRAVIERLLSCPLPGFEAVHLSGNHEDMMLAVLDDETAAGIWLMNGGAATLLSYGISFAGAPTAEARNRAICEGLRAKLPPRHADFLRGLATHHVEGDYLFVHAGIQPGLPVVEQSRDDMLWIREPFLASSADHGYCVVHGHTIVREPEIWPNRIAVDTGAFYSGRLTCLVLEGAGRRFLQS